MEMVIQLRCNHRSFDYKQEVTQLVKGASVSGGTGSPSGYIVGGTVTEGSTTKSFTVGTYVDYSCFVVKRFK